VSKTLVTPHGTYVITTVDGVTRGVLVRGKR
jgi:hypothetical protein